MIADLFHRMKYMERRGSGLRKIVSETEKLPGYLEIYSTRSLGFLYNRKKQTRNLLVRYTAVSIIDVHRLTACPSYLETCDAGRTNDKKSGR